MSSREPSQKRSIETRNSILDAGLTLIIEEGYNFISSKKIAKKAGVSIGSFYVYFKDKQELLIELCTRFKEEKLKQYYPDYENWLKENISNDDKKILLRDNISLFVKMLVESAIEHHSKLYTEVLYLTYRNEEVRKVYREYCREEASYLAKVLGNYLPHYEEATLYKAGLVIQKIIDSYALMILDPDNSEIKDSLIYTLERSIYELIHDVDREFIH